MLFSWSPLRHCFVLLLLVDFGELKHVVCAFIPRPQVFAAVDAVTTNHQTFLRQRHLLPLMKRGGTTVASLLNETSVRITSFVAPNDHTHHPANIARTNDNRAAPITFFVGVILVAAAATATASMDIGGSSGNMMDGLGASASQFLAQPQVAIQNGIDGIQSMGPMGIFYFALCFVAVDLLSIPATPLVLSAGSLFGLPEGVAVVLLSGTLSASIAFWIGQTVLRSWVQDKVLRGNPKAARFDAAIGKEGFKVLFLLRLAPIFPLSLINYVYGASSIDFSSYFWGTLLGFAPSTVVYVYMGMVGQELFFGETNGQPWYVYAVGVTAVVAMLQLISNVAAGVVAAIDSEDTTNPAGGTNNSR